MENLSLNSVSLLPASFTFSRLGTSDSNIFHCATNLAGSICYQDHPPERSYDDRFLGLSRDRLFQGTQNQLASVPRTTLAYQYPNPVKEMGRGKALQGLAHSSQHPPNHPRAQDAEALTTHLDHNLLPSACSSGRLRRAIGDHRKSTVELLPPINFVPQTQTYPISAPSPSLESTFVEHGSSPSSSMYNHNCSASWGEVIIPEHMTPKTSNLASLCIEQSLRGDSSSSGSRSLHKKSGSRELRRQAGCVPIGTRQVLQTQKESQTHDSNGSPEPRGSVDEQPITPPRKLRLWLETSSSDESIEQAVTAPKICMLRVQH